MDLKHALVEKSLDHPKLVVALMLVLAVVLAALIPAVKVDTDPENMLSEDEAVRVFHNRMKAAFDLNDMVVLGVVNEADPDGVFNPQSLGRIYDLTNFVLGKGDYASGADEDGNPTGGPLSFPAGEHDEQGVGELLAERYRWLGRVITQSPAPEQPRTPAVIEGNIIAPSEVDHVEPQPPLGVDFGYLMPEPPETREAALAIREKIVGAAQGGKDVPAGNPLYYGTMVSEDGKALCVYLPLRSKDLSNEVYVALQEKIAGYSGDDRFYITGLPVAEDVFGVEMFKQMAVSAPMAMAVIFVLMLVFFRKFVLVISPMILAMVTVIMTMGLLIGTGHTVHIMSSMIPIFIMPIAVLDSIHILSEFFDRYQQTRDRRQTASKVMDELFMPMLYTSLTSAAGFGSLALTPIPPVQVFGIFVAIGVLLAWLLTVTFIPAYIMLLGEKTLQNFGSTHHTDESHGTLSRFLASVGQFTFRRAPIVLAATVVVAALAAWGITRIRVNDNPVKWFEPGHPIRVADRVLNDHFAGTYLAYLVLEPQANAVTPARLAEELSREAEDLAAELRADGYDSAPEVLKALTDRAAAGAAEDGATPGALLRDLSTFAAERRNAAEGDAYDIWDEAEDRINDRLTIFNEPLKDPALLRYIARMQEAMESLEDGTLVGKTTSLADAVKTVYRALRGGDNEHFVIPGDARSVGQALIQFENSHRPQDLYHMVTRDYRKANVWVQLKSGDNRDMQAVVHAVEDFLQENPPPVPLVALEAEGDDAEGDSAGAEQVGWFGLTYINVVWQQKMVTGMLFAFLGSFLVVFVMMTVLFRSALWGLLSMIPLTVTIATIYGLVGFLGIDYNMPIAVLSSLTLGLAVDFAIHFLARTRAMVAEFGSWEAAAVPVFGEPARAITRNIIVIAVGFLPLLAAPLVPYKTVGVFLATILLTSGLATLLILPALITVLRGRLFGPSNRPLLCKCGTCAIAGLAAIVTVVVNLWQYLNVGISMLTWISIPLVAALFGLCCWMSRRAACREQALAQGDPS